MHRSLSSMHRLPLITLSGVRLGEITDAMFESYEQRILGFTVDWEDAIFAGADDILPLTQIVDLNADVATVPDELGVSAGLGANLQSLGSNGLLCFESLIDCQVVDETGQAIGRLADLHFDPEDGSVEFYEIAVQGREEAMLLSPSNGIEASVGRLVVASAALSAAEQGLTPTTLGISLLEAEGFEEKVGEDDLEVIRVAGAEPEPY